MELMKSSDIDDSKSLLKCMTNIKVFNKNGYKSLRSYKDKTIFIVNN